ncbi:MAG: Hint domain-containing protein [Pseudomonadota bacterium]
MATSDSDGYVVVDTDNFSTSTEGWLDENGVPLTENETLAGDPFLGRFAGTQTNADTSQQIQKTFTVPDDAQCAIIQLDFIKIDSWDTTWNNQQDMFGISLNDQVVFEYMPFGFNSPANSGDGDDTSGTISFTQGGVTYTGTYSVTSSGADSQLGFSNNGGWEERYYTIEIVIDDPPSSFTLGVGADLTQAISDESWGIDNVEVGYVCFASGTLIDTIFGEIAVEDLKPGNLVRVLNGQFKPIRWIGSQSFTAADLRTDPKLCPVKIKQGAFGNNTPSQDLKLSRQHRVLIQSKIAKNQTGSRRVLVPAKDLLILPDVECCSADRGVTYFHILFEKHEVVFSNGIPTESLFTGPEALKTISAGARYEIAKIMPQVLNIDYSAQPFCQITSGEKARALVEKHQQKGRAIYAKN